MASSEQTVPGPSAPPVAKRILKPVKTKLRLIKSDVRQCRLCMRILARADTFDTKSSGSCFRQKILDAVEVEILPSDKVTSVCVNCLTMVDIVIDFRTACRNADMLHRTKPMMLHSGSWMSDENKSGLASCRQLVQRNRAKMEELVTYSGLKPEQIEGGKKLPEPKRGSVMNFESVDVAGTVEPEEEEAEIETEEVSEEDSEPEMSDQCGAIEEVEEEVPLLNSGTEQDAQVAGTQRPGSRKDFMCDQCGKSMPKSYMEQHINMHTGYKPYECTEESCDRRFASAMLMNLHIKKFHRRLTKRFECEICQKSIKGVSFFRYHLQTHQANNARKFPCNVCGKTFYKNYLRDHMATHTGDMPYQCEFCDREFAAKNNWAAHRRKQHSDQLQQQE